MFPGDIKSSRVFCSIWVELITDSTLSNWTALKFNNRCFPIVACWQLLFRPWRRASRDSHASIISQCLFWTPRWRKRDTKGETKVAVGGQYMTPGRTNGPSETARTKLCPAALPFSEGTERVLYAHYNWSIFMPGWNNLLLPLYWLCHSLSVQSVTPLSLAFVLLLRGSLPGLPVFPWDLSLDWPPFFPVT